MSHLIPNSTEQSKQSVSKQPLQETPFERTLTQEIKYYLQLAFPLILSFSTEPIMFFFDRLFLSNYKEGQAELYLSAGFSGGLSAFLILSFFISVVGFSSTVVAQYFGAKKTQECGNITLQSMLLCLYVFPVILFISLFLDNMFALFNHDIAQQILEVKYSKTLLLGSIFTLLRSAVSGFFMGIGKNKIVMLASFLAMCINIPLNYVLIYGKFNFPSMGIVGAALATIISSACALLLLLIVYWNEYHHSKFKTRLSFRIHKNYMQKIIRYGVPTGIETFMSVAVFSFFILAMSSYGTTIGAAVSIAINWDSLFFLPVMGASMATTALVGQYMGSQNIAAVQRILKISLCMVTLLAMLMGYIFLFRYDMLISIFQSKMVNKDEVYFLAKQMLRLASIYILADGISLMVSSVLRGSGDTKALMVVLFIVNAIFGFLFIFFIAAQRVTPLGAWIIFVGFPIAISVGVTIRFLQAKWKKIILVDGEG